METPTPQCPQYGQGGDVIGAKRLRWSFRCLVMAVGLLTFSLWYAENFMRHDLHETQYISALTLQPEAARPILRSVVYNEEKRDGEAPPKYLLALAAVEEEDIILPTYEKAFEITPSDTNLLINYGVQLFLAERFTESRDRFREAGIQAPDNALPRYLEAAALLASSVGEGRDPIESGALVDALALIERTNNRNTPIVFPKPLWHPSLPTNNHWYNTRQREIIKNACSPLYNMQALAISRAAQELEAGRHQNWDAWLETLQRMGARLASPQNAKDENLGIIQTQAGLQIQQASIQLRKRVQELGGTTGNDALARTSAKIQEAIAKIREFELQRNTTVQTHAAALKNPPKLAAFSMLIVTLVYVFAWLFGLITYKLHRKAYAKPTDPAWTIPHRPVILGWLVISSLLLPFVLFMLENSAQGIRSTGVDTNYFGDLFAMMLANRLTLLLVVSTSIIGFFYAAFALPSAAKVASSVSNGESSEVAPNQDEILRTLRKMRRLAAALLLRRYAGIHWGLVLVGVCTWLLAFRLLVGVYPTDVALLTISMREQELELLRSLYDSFQ